MSRRASLAALVFLLAAPSARAFDCDGSGTAKTQLACQGERTQECLDRLVPYLNECIKRHNRKKMAGDSEMAKITLDRYNEAKSRFGMYIGESERVSGVTLQDFKEAVPPAGKQTPAGGGGGGGPGVQIGGKWTSEQAQQARDDAAKALASGNAAGAAAILSKLLANNPDDARALAMDAQVKMALGDRAGAATEAKRAVELNPADGASRALLSGLDGITRADKAGKSKLDFGNTRAPEGAGASAPQDGARAGGGGGGGAAPAKGPAPVVVTGAPAVPGEDALISRVKHLAGIGDWTGALLPLREAIDQDPKRGDLWDMLAEISSKLGNAQGALDAANHALALNSQDARALRAKSYAEFQLGRYDAAAEDARRAVALEPGNGLGYLYLAMAEEKLGETAKAIADYRKAMSLDSTLAPLVQEALKRLGGGANGAAAGAGSRLAFRGVAIGLSTLLIILGLMGTATGRALTKRALTPWKPAPARDDEPVTIEPGAVIGGHYRVTRELGRGGMGVVYLAMDETLQRPVAIKRLQQEGRGNAEDVERFLKEARLVAQLKHPRMAQIHAVIEGADPLLVFEYVEGESLDKTLARERRLAPARTRQLVAQICEALQCAHERKIIHRDLKPANVMIDHGGAAKVMDFGIAHQARGAGTMTKTAASGTPPYMAPEQGFGSVSKSSDLYALAVMTYEMLTGVRPFDGPDYFEPKLRNDFVPITKRNPALGASLDEFFARALNADPTKRPADAAAFAFELGRALDATPSRA